MTKGPRSFADRDANRPVLVFGEMLERHSVSALLVALARAAEHRIATTVNELEGVELPPSATFAEHVSQAIRRLARGIDAAEERAGLA